MCTHVSTVQQKKFRKSFTFQRDVRHTLPEEKKWFRSNIWEIDFLRGLRTDINNVKSELDDKDIDSWGQHTAQTDLSSFIRTDIKSRLGSTDGPELLTRAWVKFYEILSTHSVISLNEEKSECTLNGLFLCEAPGAFVTAANHYIKTQSPTSQFNWVASTLNPYHEEADVFGAAIIDDSLISHPTTYQNWLFGPDNTGNILTPSFLQHLVGRAHTFDFVTADGGINCADKPAEQELFTLPLMLAEILVGIRALRSNGNFIIKAFSLFECQSVCLLYLLYIAFSEVTVCKPIASKAGNSEVYIVCTGLIESPALEAVVETTLRKMTNIESVLAKEALFGREDLPLPFLIAYQECVALFTYHQKATIKQNVELFGNINYEQKRVLINGKKACSRAFFQNCDLRSIEVNSTIMKGSKNEAALAWKAYARQFDGLRSFVVLTGSLQSRCGQVEENIKADGNEDEEAQEKQKGNPTQLYTELGLLFDLQAIFDKFRYFTQTTSVLSPKHISLVYGKSYRYVKCSKFCDPSLLTLYYKYLDQGETGRECTVRHAIHKETGDLAQKTFHTIVKSYLTSLKEPLKELVCFGSSVCPLVASLTLLLDGEQRHSNCLKLVYPSGDNVSGECYSTHLHYSPKIIVIDPTCNEASAITPTQWLVGNVFKREQVKPFELHCVRVTLAKLCLFLPTLEVDDLLVVVFPTILTRLSVNLLYLITRLFDGFTLVPCQPVTDQRFAGDGKSSEIAVCSGGQLVIFSNYVKGRTLLEATQQAVVTGARASEPCHSTCSGTACEETVGLLLTRILSELPTIDQAVNQETSAGDKELLEFVPIPLVLQGKCLLDCSVDGRTCEEVDFVRFTR